MKKSYDILIIGAGLNGATMALGAAQFGLSVALFDAHKMSDQLETGFDGRSYALSLTSIRMMRSPWSLGCAERSRATDAGYQSVRGTVARWSVPLLFAF